MDIHRPEDWPDLRFGFYVLGLDLGTHAGWAVLNQDGVAIEWGTWDLSPSPMDSPGFRYAKFYGLVTDTLAKWLPRHPVLVAYELVTNLHVHKGAQAAHIYGGLKAMLYQACEIRGVAYEGQSITGMKRLATTRGNAGKDDMVEAANKRWGLNPPLGMTENNTADALWAAEHLLVNNRFKPCG